ncbi:DUF4328 domain-containing protein [Streptomyces sp. DSM 41014]|uniref:DUF4328 domain-containing protein n=1 Tax=Streptomyces hintoniae TaxID=3075521 RepID=A0ABU2UBH0_9ACTN|nr:DUF4328 domain-containing protein [Streptomyces sp. DSM 41014]MDT0470567.1 DUF4328 domain-containing protein [Streptomyces sp. DSM 41014]
MARPPGGAAPLLWGLLIAATAMLGLVALRDLYSLYTGSRICTMIEGDRGFSFALVDAYTRYGTAATLPLVAYLPCAVVSVSWFHQLRRRIGLTAPDRFGDGPGWAIGSWLIPVGALWLPYRVALEMWSAATPAPADGGVGRARRWPVHLWWALFVASVLLDRFAALRLDAADDRHEVRGALGQPLAADVLDLVSAAAAVYFATRLTARCGRVARQAPMPHPPVPGAVPQP